MQIGLRNRQYKVELLTKTPTIDAVPVRRDKPTTKAATNIKTDQVRVRFQFMRGFT